MNITTQTRYYTLESRRALLIANRYIGEGCELYGCKTDAEELKKVLEQCNFTVEMYTDLNKNKMYERFNSFAQKLNSKDSALFYYSGHGLSYQGQQLLVPCNMEQPEKEFQIRYTAFSCEYVIDELAKYSSGGLKIIITDACRTEYLQVLKGIGSNNGFNFNNVSIKFDPNNVNSDFTAKGVYWETRNIVRMCAASSGQAAEAPKGNALSIYTKSLLNNILVPKQSIMDLNIKICTELEERDAKPEISFTAPGEIVSSFRFKDNE